MSAQNEFMMNIIETDIIADAVIVPELPVSIAEILEADFRNDDEAEFLQAVLQIQTDIENVLLSDTPEDFLIPTEEGLPPAIIMIEKLEELKSFAFGDRTLARIERRLRAQNEVIRPPLNETDKANNPEYRKCPKCLRHFTKRYLGFHMDTAVCLKVSAAHNLRPMGNDKRKVSEKIYIACLDLEDLYARAIDYRKNIEGELVEEEIETSDSDIEVVDDECVYVLKTYEFNHQEKTIDYAGLWENCDGEKEWINEDDARIEFEYATEGDKGYIAVELIKIDPTKNENRETTIAEWEDNISDYLPEEEYIVKGWKYNRDSKKVEKFGDFKTDDNDDKLTLETATDLAQDFAENGYGYALLQVIEIRDGDEEIIKEFKDDTFDPYW